MNVIFLSPHFPPNYYYFCVHLNELGANVLGLADESFDRLRPELRIALREYYRVSDMHNYDELLRACGYFTHRYGKIDRIDSMNEYWLETEAHLRTDFNIPGPNLKVLESMRRKSFMKQIFAKAGVDVAKGSVIQNLKDAKRFIDEVGYPIVAKPDCGVGAASTFKITNDNELIGFFNVKPPNDFIFEEFIQGQIFTFDGLTDQDGKVVFFTSHTYSQGIMEVVNDDNLLYYYSLRDIPADLESAGLRVVKAYKLRERFFHFEFFRSEQDNRLLGLEVNMRPPGGLTTDMFNYANEIDVYKEWANIVVHNRFSAAYLRPYHCCYISRKFNKRYLHSHGEILEKFGGQILHHDSISGVFSTALGNYGYITRSSDLAEILEIAEYIQAVE